MIDGDNHHIAGEATKRMECKDKLKSTVVRAMNKNITDEDTVATADASVIEKCENLTDEVIG